MGVTKNYRLAALGVLMLLLSSVAFGCVVATRNLCLEVGSMGSQVGAFRRLAVNSQIQCVELNRASGLSEAMSSRSERISQEAQDSDAEVLIALGFASAISGANYPKSALAHAGAYYQPEQKRIALLGMGTRELLAHELVHTLQDQNFEAFEKLKSSKHLDEKLARMTLLEGDATLTARLFVGGSPCNQLLAKGLGDQVEQRLHRSEDSVEPIALQAVRVLPYVVGERVACRLYQRDRFRTLDGFLRDLPPSASALLRLADGYNDSPSAFEARTSGEGKDRFGAYMILAWLARYSAAPEALRVAEHLVSDEVTQSRRGGRAQVQWSVIWDSAQARADFMALASKRPGTKRSARIRSNTCDGELIEFTSGSNLTRVCSYGDLKSLIEAHYAPALPLQIPNQPTS